MNFSFSELICLMFNLPLKNDECWSVVESVEDKRVVLQLDIGHSLTILSDSPTEVGPLSIVYLTDLVTFECA